MIAMLALVYSGCGKRQESKEQMSIRDINLVMSDHTAELMAIPGVTGVAVGQLDNGTPCVLVLIEEESKEIVQKVPKTLEGYPVKLMVSGRIVPMGGKQ